MKKLFLIALVLIGAILFLVVSEFGGSEISNVEIMPGINITPEEVRMFMPDLASYDKVSIFPSTSPLARKEVVTGADGTKSALFFIPTGEAIGSSNLVNMGTGEAQLSVFAELQTRSAVNIAEDLPMEILSSMIVKLDSIDDPKVVENLMLHIGNQLQLHDQSQLLSQSLANNAAYEENNHVETLARDEQRHLEALGYQATILAIQENEHGAQSAQADAMNRLVWLFLLPQMLAAIPGPLGMLIAMIGLAIIIPMWKRRRSNRDNKTLQLAG